MNSGNAFNVSLSALVLEVLAFVVAARVFQSMRASMVIAVIAAVTAGILGLIVPSSGIAKAHDLQSPLWGMAGVFGGVALYCGLRLREASTSLRDQLASIRECLTPSQVAVPVSGWTEEGICWHCGCSHAPVRGVRLSRVVCAGVISVSETLTLPFPFCAEHRDNINEKWRQFATLSLLLPLLAIIAGLFSVSSLHLPGSKSELAVLGAGALGIVAAVCLVRWSRRMQTFRLLRIDSLTGVATIAFNDERRAAAVRGEADALWTSVLNRR